MQIASFILKEISMHDDDLQNLVQATSIKLNLSQFAIEKDFYLTKVI